MGSCVAIRLSSYHGNIGLFVVKENFRGCGIGTTIFDMAVAHLGEHRNKGLSAVPRMYHIYRDRAKFNKVAAWEVVMFRLDGKRLLANLANILKCAAPKQPDADRLADATDRSDDRSDCDDSSITESTNSSSRCDSEELNSINENEVDASAGGTAAAKQSKHLHNSLSSPLKDITGEESSRGNMPRDYDWIRRKKSELSLLKEHKFHTFNQLINYSAPRPHLNSLIFSTRVFPSNGSSKAGSVNSPSISLPSLLLNGSGDNALNAFDQNAFRTPLDKHLVDSSRVSIVPYSNYWLYKLIDFDEQLSGYNRSKIVRLSANEENSKTKLAVVGEQIVGYGTVKHSLQDIYLIAPLYAQSPQIASDLIREFVRSMSIQQLVKGFILKLPNCNHKAIELMESLGFEKQDYVVTR